MSSSVIWFKSVQSYKIIKGRTFNVIVRIVVLNEVGVRERHTHTYNRQTCLCVLDASRCVCYRARRPFYEQAVALINELQQSLEECGGSLLKDACLIPLFFLQDYVSNFAFVCFTVSFPVLLSLSNCEHSSTWTAFLRRRY